MVWDFAETNPLSDASQNWMGHIEWIAEVVRNLTVGVNSGKCYQADASTTIYAQDGPVIVTDPPYYDNISYADLSDFFTYGFARCYETFTQICSPEFRHLNKRK